MQPSQPLTRLLVLALVAAAGLAVAVAGGCMNNNQIEGVGFLLLATGVVPLIVHSVRRDRALDLELQQAQAEAFATAIELWRRGELTKTNSN